MRSLAAGGIKLTGFWSFIIILQISEGGSGIDGFVSGPQPLMTALSPKIF